MSIIMDFTLYGLNQWPRKAAGLGHMFFKGPWKSFIWAWINGRGRPLGQTLRKLQKRDILSLKPGLKINSGYSLCAVSSNFPLLSKFLHEFAKSWIFSRFWQIHEDFHVFDKFMKIFTFLTNSWRSSRFCQNPI